MNTGSREKWDAHFFTASIFMETWVQKGEPSGVRPLRFCILYFQPIPTCPYPFIFCYNNRENFTPQKVQ